MALPLVDVEEAQRFLGVTAGTDDDLIGELLASVQSLFENEVGRALAPFSAAQTGYTEILSGGSWSTVLTLAYPIAAVTSVVLGLDVSAPTETLIPASASSVVWRVGGRDLIRTDGGYWRKTSPKYVKVVYNTQADQPTDVKLAIKRQVARIYNEQGKEGFSSITRGARSWTMADSSTAAADPFWAAAVNNHRAAWVR